MENAANDGTYQNIILCMTIRYQIHNSYMLDHVIQRLVFFDNRGIQKCTFSDMNYKWTKAVWTSGFPIDFIGNQCTDWKFQYWKNDIISDVYEINTTSYNESREWWSIAFCHRWAPYGSIESVEGHSRRKIEVILGGIYES